VPPPISITDALAARRAQAGDAKVLCIAHVTNTMAQTDGDFEKGEADGTTDALRLLDAIVRSGILD
jgi:hypothetical protein